MKKRVDSAESYERLKEQSRVRGVEISTAGRDIGEIPAAVDPARRARGMASLKEFCELYFPERFFNAWSPDHLEVLAQIEQSALHGELFALAMPRGSGKTSMIECALIWVIFKGIHKYVAVIAATKGKAVEIVESIKTELQTNELLRQDFPEVCYPIWKLDGITQRAKGQTCVGRRTNISWLANKIVMPSVAGSAASGSIIHAAGLTGADIRGVKHTIDDDGKTSVIRPSFVLIDDPQTDKTAKSLTQNDTRERLIAGAVLGMAGPNRKIAAFLLTTVIESGDMADRILSRQLHPEWQGRRYKLLKAFPKNLKMWDEYAAILVRGQVDGTGTAAATEFYAANQAEMDAGAEAAWLERKYDDEITAIQHAMNLKIRNEAAFWSEYQNEPTVRNTGAGAIPKPKDLASRVNGRERGVVPLDTVKISAFIDVHKHILFWALCAWERDFTGYLIDYGAYPDQKLKNFAAADVTRTLGRVHPGTGEDGAIFAGLDELVGNLLARKINVAGGGIMKIDRLMIDGGYKPQIVNKVRHKHGAAVVMTKGVGIRAGSKPMSQYQRRAGWFMGDDWCRPSVAGTKELPHILIDVNSWKSRVLTAITTAVGDPAAFTLFGNSPTDHLLFAQHIVASEDYRETQGQGRTVYEWRQLPSRPDNHWFDCIVGCFVGASVEGIRAGMTATPPAAANPSSTPPVKRRVVSYL